MQKLIEVQWEGIGGVPHVGDAIVEYTYIKDDDKNITEITAIYLPEDVPSHWHAQCKNQAGVNFYNLF
jgi:hypothetical protein